METIFHITTPLHWKEQSLNDLYFSTTFNDEGFIHASTKAQLNDTANRYFSKEVEIVILEIDTRLLHAQLIYEMSKSLNQKFPHIYGGINRETIIKVEHAMKGINELWAF